jgi:hypothetical protein
MNLYILNPSQSLFALRCHSFEFSSRVPVYVIYLGITGGGAKVQS